MARDDILSREQLIELQRRLSTMSVTAIADFYRVAYVKCKLDGDRVPAGRAVQELVQAWKGGDGTDD